MKNIYFLTILFALIIPCTSQGQTGGLVYTVAGGGSYTADGVPATNEQFSNTSGVAVDGAGNYYVADYGTGIVRKIDAVTGLIYKVAGGGTGGLGDGGPATNAVLSMPRCIYFDKYNNLYIADGGNSRVRKVAAASGMISTVAGGGTSTAYGIPATNASIGAYTVYVDINGNVYTGGNNTVCKVDGLTGIISIIAGNGSAGDGGDGGPATNATISGSPKSISMDASGNLYFIAFSGDKVRKVDAVTGIITTVAGGGTSSADGVPATSESFSDFHNCAVDGAGNLFIADWHRAVRRVDAVTGIINTIGGILAGGGSSADGIPATSASVLAYLICIDPIRGNVYYSDYATKSRKFSFSPIVGFGTGTTSDSFNVTVNKVCNGPELTVITPNYVAGRSVKTFFGDGSTDSNAFTPGFINGGYAITNHTYSSAGNYTIKHILYLGSTVVDTISYLYNYTFCRTLPLSLFNDANANCIKDTGEAFAMLPSLTEVDSNGIAVDTLAATSGFNFNAYCQPGDIYQFKVIENPGNYSVTCPSTGYLSDTVLSSVTNYPDKYFGIRCSAPSFDISESSYVVAGIHDAGFWVTVNNTNCSNSPATLTMNVSPKYTFCTCRTYPAPTTISGNTVTWDFISGTKPQEFLGFYYAISGLTNTDTFHCSFFVTPTAGDINPANNSEIILDTVKASSDPNGIAVKPEGYILSGTELNYAIHFENDGNDTAYNIYVMDTLSENLDLSSFRMVSSNYEMYTTKIKYILNKNILRFDFPNINLLDSSHHGQCDGLLFFKINAKAGLANGTEIYNHAGIFFDYNPVVTTETVENIIGSPEGLPLINEQNDYTLYPNPVNDELTIKSEKNAFSYYTITNTIGQLILQQAIIGIVAQVNVQHLPVGVYYIILRGENGSVVRKFVKM